MYINCLLIYFPSDYTLPEDQDCTMKKKNTLHIISDYLVFADNIFKG